ncbi:MAG: lipopolysaccharide biosynthesis protein [Tannerellaceae bacterium]|jgi:O-antigen/teichoic acid export membrane protein|nr:lipopolysaccharide biosynthesis protein [Tannerellaceae bacterium]
MTSDTPQTQEPTLKEKTAKGLFWGGVSNLVQQIIGAAFNIIIARILSPNDYGLIGMLAIFTAIANTLMDSGFTTALINRKVIRHEDYNAVFWFSVILGAVLYVALFFAAPLIAAFYELPVLTNLSRLVFLSFLINSMALAHNALLVKKLMVKERAKIDITAVSLSGAVGLILALSGFAYWGLALQAILMAAISVALRWYFAPWRPSFGRIDFEPLKGMLGFGIKLLVTSIVVQVSMYIFSVIVGKVYGERPLGYYSQGQKWMLLGNVVVLGMIASVAQPILVETRGDMPRQLNIFRKMMRFGAFISFPAFGGLAFVSREFILITLGEKWSDSIPILQLFCIFGATSFLVHLYYLLLIIYEKTNVVMWYCIIYSLLLLATAIFSYTYGILAMVIAYMGLHLLSIGAWHERAARIIGLHFIHLIKDVIPYFIITFACILIAWIFTIPVENIYVIFFMKIGITALLYIVLMKFSASVIFKESMELISKRYK